MAAPFCSASHRTCDECPWRKDVPIGKFPPERFAALRHTASGPDAFKPIFACHKTAEGRDLACVGYLLVSADSNLFVRMAAATGRFDPERLQAAGPLFDSFQDMAAANGCLLEDQQADEEDLTEPADLAERIAKIQAMFNLPSLGPQAEGAA